MISRRDLLLGTAACLSAQDAKFSADVNVVTLLATVRDRDGRVVKDLDRDDFLLQEDRKPQKIQYFSRESDLPLTIGLLVDTSRSQRGVLEAALERLRIPGQLHFPRYRHRIRPARRHHGRLDPLRRPRRSLPSGPCRHAGYRQEEG